MKQIQSSIIVVLFSSLVFFATSAQSNDLAFDRTQVSDTVKIEKNKPLLVNAIDPVCKMQVSKGSKVTATYKEKLYGFCSESDRKKFKANPTKYVQQ